MPEENPIPERIRRPSAAETAERDAAEAAEAAEEAAEAAAERAEAFAAALEALTEARVAYDEAKLDYASAKADYDASLRQAGIVHELAREAAAAADTSRRVLAALIRSLTQRQSDNATVDVIFGPRDGGDLLHKLGTLDKLSQLTGNIGAIRERAEADEARAQSLLEQDAAAQDALAEIPVAETREAMEEAEADVTAAEEFLADLTASFQAGALELTRIPQGSAAVAEGRSAQGWVTPAVGDVNSGFGPRPVRPVPGVGVVHFGSDIGAACGAAIYAAASGVVVAVGRVGTYGNWIMIDHGEGIETGYAHVAPDQTLVSVGEAVIAGQVIAGVGTTGASTGCHLHFEVRVDGVRVDPESFLTHRGIAIGR